MRSPLALLAVCAALFALVTANPAARAEPAPLPRPHEARGWEKPPGPSADDIGLAVPRGIFLVPRLVLEGVFWPVQQGLRLVEHHKVVEHVVDFFYNDERTAGVLPSLSFNAGFGPSLGISASYDNITGHGEELAFQGRFGGIYQQAYELSFAAERAGGTRFFVESSSRYQIEPRLIFQGIGDNEPGFGRRRDPRAIALQTRYQERRALGLLRLGYELGEPGGIVRFGGTGIFNHRTFGGKAAEDDDPSIEIVYDTSKLTGFDDGVSTLELDANFTLDTRDVGGMTASGVLVNAFAGGVPGFNRYRYGHYGAEITGFLDVWRKTRVLVGRVAIEGVEGDYDRIPFSDLPRLGGARRLRGYTKDRFRDEKSVVTTIEYRYPIHQYIAGSLFLDAGRVAPNYVELSRVDTWNLGGGVGFVFRTRDRTIFAVDLAYGDDLRVNFTTDPLRAFHGREEQL